MVMDTQQTGIIILIFHLFAHHVKRALGAIPISQTYCENMWQYYSCNTFDMGYYDEATGMCYVSTADTPQRWWYCNAATCCTLSPQAADGTMAQITSQTLIDTLYDKLKLSDTANYYVSGYRRSDGWYWSYTNNNYAVNSRCVQYTHAAPIGPIDTLPLGANQPGGGNCFYARGRRIAAFRECTSGAPVGRPYLCQVHNVLPCANADCALTDKKAGCTNNADGLTYTCGCSAAYEGATCDFPTGMQGPIMATTASMGIDPTAQPMPAAMADDSALSLLMSEEGAKDMVALLSEDERKGASWQMADYMQPAMTNWCTYESEPCNQTVHDVALYHEPGLGNCFAFNGNGTSPHDVNWPGVRGGVHMRLSANQRDYTLWIQTAGFRVFVHHQDEMIFGEASGVSASTGQVTNIGFRPMAAKKLPEPYSDCVDSPSQVDKYYFPGDMYSQDACYRSCHQNRLLAQCGCVDNRYPQPPGENRVCELEDKDCGFDAVDGDVDEWDDCVCPPACSALQYSYTVTRAPMAATIARCEGEADAASKAACVYNHAIDYAVINVYQENPIYKIYQEEAAMPFITFMSYVGGNLGILAGISVFSMIEFVFYVILVILAILCGFIL